MLSATVAGEDLSAGDFVSVLVQTFEFPSFFWPCGEHALAPTDVVRLTVVPSEAGELLRVVGVSLPFVYVEKAVTGIAVIDIRSTQLVRVAPDTAKVVWKKLRAKPKTTD